MDLMKLDLSPREQHILESMGLDTVEKVALRYGHELGLSERKGETIVNRARNLVAYERIKAIDCSDNAVTVILSDTSRATVVSAEDVLGAWGGDLKRVIEGNKLIILAPERKPCSCGKEPVCICRACEASLCQECRYKHEHGYYQAVEISSLKEAFRRVRVKAEEYSPMPSEKRAEVEVRPSEEVISLARAKGFAGFVDSFFYELEGNELVKKALACALFSTPEEPVHVLVIGDPAGGKTLARDIIARRLGPEIELVGANATRAGLVCNLATGEPGVLTYSDGKVVLVDEFDKIPDQDIEYCYELLSNGKCSIHSARVHETIESHFIMIAFANPVGTVFAGQPIKEIGLPPILLSRFALIMKAEELEASRRKALLRRKLLGETAASELSQQLLPWLRQAKNHHPRFTASDKDIEAYVDRVDKLIEGYLKTPLRRDLRMGDYAKRVPLAMARASFSDIDNGTLKQASELMESSISAWLG
jgi:DNA replicative helicase MCM subunit Mcm2 (Cdc46/Mcm family)